MRIRNRNRKEEKDGDCHVQQRLPESTIKSFNVVDRTIESVDENKKESYTKVIHNQRYEESNESTKEKEQGESFREELTEKQQQEENEDDINGEFESFDEDRITNNSNREISKNKKFDSIIDLSEVIKNERLEEYNKSKRRKVDSFEEELPSQQQKDINGEFELNRVTGEDSLPDNSDRILNDNNVSCGSKLLTRDENDRNYRIKQGIPRSIKFRSITDLYKCTDRLSPIEDEYNWNLPTTENSNVNLLAKKRFK